MMNEAKLPILDNTYIKISNDCFEFDNAYYVFLFHGSVRERGMIHVDVLRQFRDQINSILPEDIIQEQEDVDWIAPC